MTAQLAILLRHEIRRAWAGVRHPEPGVWVGVLLPLTLVVGALWAAGDRARPDLSGIEGAAVWGFAVAAAPTFFAYGILFRPADDPFLRRLGFAPAALFAARALRLLALGMGAVAVALIPFVAAREALVRPLAIGVAGALAAWALALLAFAVAARTTTPESGARKPGPFSLLMGPDRELVGVAPLFYAPLAPLLGGPIAAGFAGAAPGAAWERVFAVAALAAAAAVLAARPFARALPRFAPRALEMAFAPPPPTGETEFVLDRGLARLLPRNARAARARDAAVTARRFRWTTGIVWPVALLATVALARWGEQAEVRTWIALAGALTLLAQAGATVALGRAERGRTRWIDRALGLGRGARWVGRWALGFGLSLWLTVPLALVWEWWAPASPGWPWLLAGAASAAAAALASLAAAGR